MQDEIAFTALVKQVSSKSLVSGDKSYRVLLESNDDTAMFAAHLPGDVTVKVVIAPAVLG